VNDKQINLRFQDGWAMTKSNIEIFFYGQNIFLYKGIITSKRKFPAVHYQRGIFIAKINCVL